ncbi:MAG: peptidyl-prolyl cis-trans isomerase, partial [Deltaproteobacteria bacterium]|nr:peptidyl-prolyl cis-trans isomerase [Deltaproteobacteria bacterium]
QPGETFAPSYRHPSQSIVARVNGRPILLVDLRRQMKEAKQEKHRALDALIQEELLAQEARRRGYDTQSKVLEAARRQLATTYIKEAFGKTISREAIPREFVERAYKANRLRYVRPAAVDVLHLLCVAGRRQSKAIHDAAARCATAASKLISARYFSSEDFKRLPESLAAVTTPTTVRVEKLTTPLRGLTVAPFADAAFALKNKGDISPPVKTRFGIHFIYLLERHAGRHQSLANAEDEIRGRLFNEAWGILFDRWAKKLEKTRHAVTDVAALNRALGQALPGQASPPAPPSSGASARTKP